MEINNQQEPSHVAPDDSNRTPTQKKKTISKKTPV